MNFTIFSKDAESQWTRGRFISDRGITSVLDTFKVVLKTLELIEMYIVSHSRVFRWSASSAEFIEIDPDSERKYLLATLSAVNEG